MDCLRERRRAWVGLGEVAGSEGGTRSSRLSNTLNRRFWKYNQELVCPQMKNLGKSTCYFSGNINIYNCNMYSDLSKYLARQKILN